MLGNDTKFWPLVGSIPLYKGEVFNINWTVIWPFCSVWRIVAVSLSNSGVRDRDWDIRLALTYAASCCGVRVYLLTWIVTHDDIICWQVTVMASIATEVWQCKGNFCTIFYPFFQVNSLVYYFHFYLIFSTSHWHLYWMLLYFNSAVEAYKLHLCSAVRMVYLVECGHSRFTILRMN